jgi:hypothetical protein
VLDDDVDDDVDVVVAHNQDELHANVMAYVASNVSAWRMKVKIMELVHLLHDLVIM